MARQAGGDTIPMLGLREGMLGLREGMLGLRGGMVGLREGMVGLSARARGKRLGLGLEEEG